MKAASKPRKFYVVDQWPSSEGPLDDSIDLRSSGEEGTTYHQVVKAAFKPRKFYVVDQWPSSEGPLDNSIDPRSSGEEGTTGPIEDLVDLPIDHKSHPGS